MDISKCIKKRQEASLCISTPKIENSTAMSLIKDPSRHHGGEIMGPHLEHHYNIVSKDLPKEWINLRV